MYRHSKSWPLLPLVLALAACGGGGDDAAPEPVKPAAITLNLAADEATLPWNKAASLKVLANDSASRGSLSLAELSTPAHGTAKISGSEIEYTPTAGYVGADSFSYTAQAEDGSKASIAVNLKINAALLLKGVVSDGPIANAVVTATVGSKTFSASADAQGAYSLPVQTDSLSDAVQLSASGVGTQSMVKLQSLLGDVAALAKLADKEGLLSSAQTQATQVTHYSTALAALVLESNGNLAPTSQAKLDELSVAVSGDRLIELATAIKLVVDKGVALPTGVADTAALVGKPATATVLADFLKAQQALPIYAATRGEVLAGAGQSGGPVFAPSSAQTQLYFIAEVGRSHLQRLDYRPDGSATMTDGRGTREAKWRALAGEIEVTPLAPISSLALSAEADPVTHLQWEIRYDTLAYRFKQLAAGQVLVSSRSQEEILSGSNKGKITDHGWSEAFAANSQDLRSFRPVVATEFPVGARFPGIFVEAALKESSNTADIMAITGSNTAKLEISGATLSWSIVDGQFVTLSPSGAERRYQMLREKLAGNLVMLMATDYSKGLPQRAVTALASRTETQKVFTTADTWLYKRWGSGSNQAGGIGFFLEFSAGGSGNSISVSNGVESKSPLTWGINPDGSLRMLRSGGRFIREWKLVALEGSTLVVLEYQELASDGSIQIPPRINVYSDGGGVATPVAANTLTVNGGESYPLRVFFTLDAAGLISGGDYDFHKLDGTMTPCEYSPANQATCHGTSASVSKSSQGAAINRSTGTAAAASLVVGPDDYGYTFTGTITGLDWVGTWTKVATPNSSLVQSGSFAVKVGIR